MNVFGCELLVGRMEVQTIGFTSNRLTFVRCASSSPVITSMELKLRFLSLKKNGSNFFNERFPVH